MLPRWQSRPPWKFLTTQLDGKIGSGYEKSDPPRPFLILAAWKLPKPIHFWKGHRRSGRNGVVKIFPHPGVGTKIVQSMACNIPF